MMKRNLGLEEIKAGIEKSRVRNGPGAYPPGPVSGPKCESPFPSKNEVARAKSRS